MSDKQRRIRFVVFCLEAFKQDQCISGDQAAMLFVKQGVTEYLLNGYDLLHTLGEQALVADIRRYLASRGA